jgi:hypothetical protein
MLLSFRTNHMVRAALFGVLLLSRSSVSALAQEKVPYPETPISMTAQRAGLVAGPFSGYFLRGGMGLSKKLKEHAPIFRDRSAWSLSLWFRTDDASSTALLAGIGAPDEVSPRYLGISQGRPFFWTGGRNQSLVEGPTALAAATWHSLAVSLDAEGVAHLVVDGVAVASKAVTIGTSSNVLTLAPVQTPPITGFRILADGWLTSLFRIAHLSMAISTR